MQRFNYTNPYFSKLIRFLFLGVGLAFFACGSIPQPNYYTLNFADLLENNGTSAKTYPFTVGLSKFESGLLLSDDRLIYRQSDYEIKFWNYQRWIAQPNIMVSEFLIEYLKSRKLFTHVVKFPSTTRVKYVLGGKLLAFEEWDQDGKWFGKVAFEINLRDIEKEQILWRKQYEKIIPVEQQLPVGVVAAISQALYGCFSSLGNDLSIELDAVIQK